jgi:hypothetical protein
VKEEPGQKQVVIFVCFFLYIWMWVNIYLYISNTHIYDKRRLYTKGVGRLLFNQERKLGDQSRVRTRILDKVAAIVE